MAKGNPAFMAPKNLSPELAAVVGAGPMSRPEVTKKIWVYIKANKLQDPNDMRTIVPDDKLKKVLGPSSVNMMKMGGLISKHLS